MVWAIPQALAVDAQAIRDDDYNLLQQGELQSIALTSDGFLLPTYQREDIGDTGSEIVWDTLREAKGALCATGHQGRLVRVSDGGTSQTLADVPEAELTALVRLADGSVLAAAAPTGRLYRLATDDSLTTYTTLEGVTWVWRMVRASDGMVWLVTGAEGRLFRLDPSVKEPKAEEIARFKSTNLLDLWIDEDGQFGQAGDIFVAGQNPGWLYRYRPSSKKVEVVYNSNAEEIRALTATEYGLALALNTERAPTPVALNLTLRMAGGATTAPEGMTGGAPGTPAPNDAEQAQALGKAFAASGGQQYGPPRSEVVLLDTKGFERKLWPSPERPIHDMALSPEGQLLVAAGNQGRLFEVRDDGSFSVVCDLREDYLVRIRPGEKGYLLATGRNGLIFDMGRVRVEEAIYLSRAIDAGSLVQWGKFYWRGDLLKGQSVKVAFRLGNDGDVSSDFWADWTKDQSIENGEPVALPAGPGRYLQYRLKLGQEAKSATAVRMDYAEAFYIQSNAAPVITDIKVMDASVPGQPQKPGNPPSAPGSAQPAGTPTTATGQANGQSQSSGRDDRSNSMNMILGWTVFEPNQDSLIFALYFRAEDEEVWKLIDDELTINKLPLDISGVADGRYRFKVVASDAPSNAPGRELTGEIVSAEIIIDNTPPQVVSKAVRVKGRTVTLDLKLSDTLSTISTVKMDLDNGDASPLLSVDGLLDELSERVEWKLEGIEPGEHVVTFSVTDQRGNTAVEKMVFTVDK